MTTKSVHLIGIGGVGMAGLAVLLKSRGCAVSGCDIHVSPRTAWLEAQGVRVFIGHDPSHLAGVDAVVATPAVERSNPELLACSRDLSSARHAPGAKRVAEGNVPSGVDVRPSGHVRALPSLRYRGEVLAEIVNETDDTIAVCGSHGKTTTATWIAKLLKALGEDVSWCIGGETGSFPVAHVAAAGQSGEQAIRRSISSPLVVEADESDGTLALYRAKTLVVNKCEYDHPDHFKTEADYFVCYEVARKNAAEVIESERLEGLGEVERLEGLAPHNLKNARAAIEVALRRGHKIDAIMKALPPIVAELPDRRFQVVYPTALGLQLSSRNSVTAVTDYAHHPTEMKCAVGMARARCTGRLRVLFQPHRYSRTKALLKNFPAAFDGADEVVLCPTYAAFEKPIEGGDIADLYRECRAQLEDSADKKAQKGVKLMLARSCEEAWEHARNSMADGDLTLLLGAGDIINLVPQVQKDLCALSAHALRQREVRRIWIGAGSNTWKSDLNLDVEYVRTEGPANEPGVTLGIPWMAGIPGTIGGWIKMNAGAFGHSISEVIAKVKVDGKWLPAADCGFSYRHSDITGEIQDVILKPMSGEAPSSPLRENARDSASPFSEAYFLAKRRKFPPGTFGSVFKNPTGDYAGRLLEEAGAKGLKIGGACVWEEHANVIVRGSDATPSDVLALARLMRNRVLFRFGIALEPEVQGIVF